MKIANKIHFIFLIVVILLCSTIPTSVVQANAVPVEKNVQKFKKRNLNNKKRNAKKNQKKRSILAIKTIKKEQQQSYYGVQGAIIFFIILIVILAAALALFIAGLVLNIPTMWIPCLVLISIPILAILIILLVGAGRKKEKPTIE